VLISQVGGQKCPLHKTEIAASFTWVTDHARCENNFARHLLLCSEGVAFKLGTIFKDQNGALRKVLANEMQSQVEA
jgi:hypothetical protein